MLIILSLLRARWLLPCLEVIWGVITFAQSRATNVTQLYVARFFIGALEAPVFAGTHFILGTSLGLVFFLLTLPTQFSLLMGEPLLT